MESLLLDTLSVDNDTRVSAERAITEEISKNPKEALTTLLNAVGNSDSLVQKIALVLIRTFFVSDSSVHAQVFQVLQSQATANTPNQKLIGEMLVKVSVSFPGELFVLISNLFAQLQEFSLYLLELATEHPSLLSYLGQSELLSVLHSSMNSDEPEISMSSIITLLAYISETEVPSSGTASAILALIKKHFERVSEEKMCKVLTHIAEITEINPRIWKDCTEELVTIMSTISNSRETDSAIRSSSIEVLSTLLGKIPSALSQQSGVLICQTAIALISESFDRENELHILGKELMAKAAVCLDPELVFSHVNSISPSMLSGEPLSQFTAVLILGLISEGCANQLLNHLTEAVRVAVSFAGSSQQELVWVSIHTVKLFCAHLSPHIQKNHAVDLLKCILTILQGQNAETSEEAMLALLNFARGILKEDDSPVVFAQFSQQILMVLASFVSNSQASLRKNALSCISVTATVLKQDFVGYYPELMTVLSSILGSHNEEDEVKEEAVRCIGHVIETLREDPSSYKEGVAVILNGLMTLKARDECVLSIIEILPQFADILQEEFLPCFQQLLPDLLAKMNIEVDINLVESDLQNKEIVINNTALQYKIKSHRVIYDIISIMKTLLAPFIEAILDILVNGMLYPYSSDIRKNSVKSAVLTLSCVENPLVYFHRLVGIFVEGLHTKILPSDTKNLLKGLFGCFELAGDSSLSEEEVQRISDCMRTHLQRLVARENERNLERAKYESAELYSEELETLSELQKIDNKIVRLSMEILGTFLKRFRVSYKTNFHSYFFDFFKLILENPNASHDYLLSAICVFDDYIEYIQDFHWENSKSFIVEQLIHRSMSKDPEIRQSAAYGLGVCAEFGGPSFADYKPHCASILTELVKETDTEFQVATDCAVGALGKLAIFQEPSLLDIWGLYLPITAEEEEARNVHRLFLQHWNLFSNRPNAHDALRRLQDLTGSEFIDQESLGLLQQIIN